MEIDEEGSKSKYNSGLLEIYRISNILQRCNIYKTKGLLEEYRRELDSLWDELNKDALKLDGSNLDSSAHQIKIKFFDKMINLSAKPSTNPAVHAQNRNRLYYFLREKERALRLIIEDSGKGGSYEDEDDF